MTFNIHLNIKTVLKVDQVLSIRITCNVRDTASQLHISQFNETETLFRGIEIRTTCKALGHNFLLDTGDSFRVWVLWSIFFRAVSWPAQNQSCLRKNKEYTSSIRITTQRTSSATACGGAFFQVCFPVKIYCILFRLHADTCRTVITENLPLISHGYFGTS